MTTSSEQGLTVEQFRADRAEYGFTATSFAVLGLLGLGEWTTYELAHQMQRSFSYFWPRAERRIYDEPKRLAAAGYAEARREVIGRRPRSCWNITARGRQAVRHWLGEPTTTPLTMEFEGMLKVFLAEQGGKRQLLDTLAAIGTEAVERHSELTGMAAEIAAGQGRFPEREHLNALTMQYMLEVSELTARWSAEAAEVVRGWHNTATPGGAAREAARSAFVRFAAEGARTAADVG